MDTHVADELRDLRERAYGPDADIHLDEDALRRLAELEGSRTLVEPPAEPEPAPAQSVESPAPGSHEDVDGTVPPPSVQAKPRWPLAAWWAASVLLAAFLTAWISNMVIQVAHTDALNAGATQVAVLREDVGFDIPRIFSSGGALEARAFEEFYGLRVFSTAAGYMGMSTGECISVAASADVALATGNSFTGAMYRACGANEFPAVVPFIVTDEFPQELRDAFPDGTALQFVYDEAGGDVVVFSSPGEPTE